jgi:hypothetical protein
MICTELQLIEFLKTRSQLYIDYQAYFESITFEHYQYAQKALAASLEQVQSHLAKVPTYNTQVWTPFEMEGENKTFVQGVTKGGQPVYLLVRPDLNNFYIHSDLEKQVLVASPNEIWAYSPINGVRQIAPEGVIYI